jgi:hypothetical protein
MADVQTRPTTNSAGSSVGDLPRTAADAGQVAVYDNDPTDSRPASVLDAPSEGVRQHDTVAPPSGGGFAWVIGIVILLVLLFFAFRILF